MSEFLIDQSENGKTKLSIVRGNPVVRLFRTTQVEVVWSKALERNAEATVRNPRTVRLTDNRKVSVHRSGAQR